MAKPLPKLVIPPSSKHTGKPADVPIELWTAITKAAKQYGVTPQLLAGVWRVESGSTYPNPHVNGEGYGGLFGTTNWSAPTQAQADSAASTLRGLIAKKGNIHDALLAYSGGGYYDVPGVTVPRTPAQVASDQAAAANAKAQNPTYVQSTTNLSVVKTEALASAKAAAHVTDPWITVQRSNGQVTGFGEAMTPNPPSNVLTIGGIPATKSDYQFAWSNTYASDYEAFTGQPATPAVQAQILESGVSSYQLKQQLASRPGFTSSPIYKANALGIADQAKQVLGTAPPASFVRDALAQGWSADTITAKLRALPAYEKGPVFQQNFDQAKDVYAGIYGTKPNQQHTDWLKNAAMNGWSTDEIAQKLRADPAYTTSPEFAAKADNLLSALGLPTTAPAALPPLPMNQPEAQTGSDTGVVAGMTQRGIR